MKSFHSPKIEIRQSGIQGAGSFAIEPIKKGEIVAIKSGIIRAVSEVKNAQEYLDGTWPISDEYVLAPELVADIPSVRVMINHSCDANVGVYGQIYFVAMRDILPGEELTQDYATIDDADYSMSCNCGAKNCRGTITGKDWKIPAIQEKYRGYFALYLQEKINKAQNKNS